MKIFPRLHRPVILFAIILLACAEAAQAQNMVRTAANAGGGFFDNGEQTLSITLGDCSAFIFYEDECVMWSTGFQQADEFRACAGDLTHDQIINITDLLLFNSLFGNTGACVDADLDHNRQVNVVDFLIFSSVFGEACE